LGSTAASPSASVGRIREARRPRGPQPCRQCGQHRQRAHVQREGLGQQPAVHELPAQPAGQRHRRNRTENPGGHRHDLRLPVDHPPDLPGGGGHRPQQRDLSGALLHQERERAGDHEQHHHQRGPTERPGQEDEQLARLGRVKELHQAAVLAGVDARVGPLQGRTDPLVQGLRVHTWLGQHADRVHPAGVPGQPFGLGGGKEQRRLACQPACVRRRRNTRDPVGARRGRCLHRDLVADPDTGAAGQLGVQDDLVRADRRPALGERERRERGRVPRVSPGTARCVGVVGGRVWAGWTGQDHARAGYHVRREAHLADGGAHAVHLLDPVGQRRVDPRPFRQQQAVGLTALSIGR
jgi:hypothetical protein